MVANIANENDQHEGGVGSPRIPTVRVSQLSKCRRVRLPIIGNPLTRELISQWGENLE